MSAESKILGYYYQFDKSILQILSSGDGDAVTLEGVEDIDVSSVSSTEFVQCKYLTSANENFLKNPHIRNGVLEMLAFFRSNSGYPYKFIFHVHIPSIPIQNRSLTLAELKDLLTKKNYKRKAGTPKETKYYEDLGYSDGFLNNFLSVFEFNFGPEFSQQKSDVMDALAEALSCGKDEADHLYYSNALRLVVDLSSSIGDPANRTIDKKTFLSSIDSTSLLYSKWYMRLMERDKYLKFIKAKVKNVIFTRANNKRVFLWIGSDILANSNDELTIAEFISSLCEFYYKANKSPWNAFPLTFIIDTDSDNLRQVKAGLSQKAIIFNDGSEIYSFSPSIFDNPPVINRNQARSKFTKTSYRCRVISGETYKNNFNEIMSPDSLAFFSSKNFTSELPSNSTLTLDVKYVETLQEVFLTLKP